MHSTIKINVRHDTVLSNFMNCCTSSIATIVAERERERKTEREISWGIRLGISSYKNDLEP